MTPWIVMPFINCWDMTEQAIQDGLAQTGLPAPPQVLAIDNGSLTPTRDAIDAWAEREPRLHVWHHRPPLTSLSATWNRALDFVWGQGEKIALVVNNDVRLNPWTYHALHQAMGVTEALFVSAVGRREADMDWDTYLTTLIDHTGLDSRGGPDFSCFLITRACHDGFPFDEGFIPAYCEDLDYHRRVMLGGYGDKIFSVNVPYLHYASGTINQETDPAKLARWATRIEQSRAHYRRKWGGDVNQERWTIPFDADTDQEGVTTPELQARSSVG